MLYVLINNIIIITTAWPAGRSEHETADEIFYRYYYGHQRLACVESKRVNFKNKIIEVNSITLLLLVNYVIKV